MLPKHSPGSVPIGCALQATNGALLCSSLMCCWRAFGGGGRQHLQGLLAAVVRGVDGEGHGEHHEADEQRRREVRVPLHLEADEGGDYREEEIRQLQQDEPELADDFEVEDDAHELVHEELRAAHAPVEVRAGLPLRVDERVVGEAGPLLQHPPPGHLAGVRGAACFGAHQTWRGRRHPHSPPPNSPNQDFGGCKMGKLGQLERNGGKWGGTGENGGKWAEIRENAEKWRKMGRDRGKWRKIGGNKGKCRKMEENGGKWGGMEENGGGWGKMGEMEGKWGNSGHSTWDVGCGGLRWNVVEENRTKTGGKWEENGIKYPFFTVPFPPFSRRSKTFPPVPFVKISAPHSPTGKWEFLPLTDTHCHGGWCGCA